MRIIDRYPLQPAKQGIILCLRKEATILSVSQDLGTYSLHVMVDDTMDIEPRRIRAFMDGDGIPDDVDHSKMAYIGTTSQPGTSHCWSFFDCGPDSFSTTPSRGHVPPAERYNGGE